MSKILEIVILKQIEGHQINGCGTVCVYRVMHLTESTKLCTVSSRRPRELCRCPSYVRFAFPISHMEWNT